MILGFGGQFFALNQQLDDFFKLSNILMLLFESLNIFFELSIAPYRSHRSDSKIII